MEISTKPQRVTLTKSQSGERLGRELLKLCGKWLHDGQLDDGEMTELQVWVDSVPEDSIPAIRFLREEINTVLKDGIVDEWELIRIHRALLRVIPKSERDPLSEAMEVWMQTRLERKRAERPASVSSMAGETDEEFWKRYRTANAGLWSSQPATEAQVSYIIDLGGQLPSPLNKYTASKTLDRLLGNEEVHQPAAKGGCLFLLLGMMIVPGLLFVAAKAAASL